MIVIYNCCDDDVGCDLESNDAAVIQGMDSDPVNAIASLIAKADFVYCDGSDMCERNYIELAIAEALKKEVLTCLSDVGFAIQVDADKPGMDPAFAAVCDATKIMETDDFQKKVKTLKEISEWV